LEVLNSPANVSINIFTLIFTEKETTSHGKTYNHKEGKYILSEYLFQTFYKKKLKLEQLMLVKLLNIYKIKKQLIRLTFYSTEDIIANILIYLIPSQLTF
jgi:hypothetical protein